SSFGTTASAAIAFVMVAVALVAAMATRPTAGHAAGVGVALVLAIGAGPVGAIDLLTAVLALGIIGVVNAIAGGNTVLRIRVWWTRRGWLLVAGAITFVAVWIFLFVILSGTALHVPLAAMFAPLGNAAGLSAASRALSVPRFYLAIIGFYEFAIAIAALAGVVAILARRIRSYFAGWCLAWMLVSLAVWTIAQPYRAEFAIGFIVPMALAGAWGIEWLHQLRGWEIVRYPAAAIALLAMYAQFVTSAVIAAPNAAEARWERRASLLWSGAATTAQTPVECARARKLAGPGATAAVPDNAPAIAWYLRTIASAADPANATVTASRLVSGVSANPPASVQFGFEESWTPDFSKLTAAEAARFMLTAHAWSAVEIHDLAIDVRQSPRAAATLVPLAAPSATASATPSASPTPTASLAPNAPPTPTASPSASAGSGQNRARPLTC
ncbi:MAG: hypothetical protein ACYDC3_00225, partial [Candidatus Binataceae bacterium]